MPESVGHGMRRCAVGWDDVLCRRGFRGTGSVPLIGGTGAQRPEKGPAGARGRSAPKKALSGGTGPQRPEQGPAGARGRSAPKKARPGYGAAAPRTGGSMYPPSAAPRKRPSKDTRTNLLVPALHAIFPSQSGLLPHESGTGVI
jgi:hypothetical protein